MARFNKKQQMMEKAEKSSKSRRGDSFDLEHKNLVI
jgi:hypothetical protein